jgi:cell wall-associated NlpC family hydrolase
MGSELLYGEAVSVFETSGGWAWVQNSTDGYVGYLRADTLGAAGGQPTHYVSVLRTYIFSGPDIKSPVLDLISMNSPLCEAQRQGDFFGLPGGGWVWAGHAASSNDFERDHAAVALRFLETPYLWGGRSSLGLDCSGLIQMALARCGKPVPRDSDMQAKGAGEEVPYDGDDSVLTHGDLIFWPGHVGIWLDGGDFVHANATDMMVSAGRFPAIASQIRDATGSDVTGVRRVR